MNPKKIARKIIPKQVIPALEQGYRYSRGAALGVGSGLPARGLKVIAITGTNGKTTTAAYMNSILKAAGYRTAIQTTVFDEIDGEYKKVLDQHTTGTTKQTMDLFRNAKKHGVDFVILEATSQALHQYKLWGVPIYGAIFTNLTYEHMDYHKTMENYARAKAQLFKKRPMFSAINGDSDWFDYFNKFSPRKTKVIWGSAAQCDLKIKDIDYKGSGSIVSLEFHNEIIQLDVKLVGRHNVLNAVAATGLSLAMGIEIAAIKKGVAELTWLDGRLNVIDEGQPFAVYSDYAHTPDGLEQALKSLREITKGKIILVQSNYDGRDPKKRPLLGEVAGKFADQIFVTDEEATQVPLAELRVEIISGIKKVGAEKKYKEIEGRQKAIDAAIKSAKAGDSVLIVPQGHLGELNYFGVSFPWIDREAAARALHKIGYKKHDVPEDPTPIDLPNAPKK